LEEEMRKVIYAMNVSVDGFIETASGDINFTNPDAEIHQHFNDWERTIDVHLYGRRLYETMAAYWPTADENPAAPEVEIEYARIWKSIKNIVFSRTLTQVDRNSQLFRGNITEEINKLKAQPGKDMNVGGANLAATFIQLGLIDEYHVYVWPVILGSGKPMFPHSSESLKLTLVETHRFGSGVVLLRLVNKI
jgi:dihydrofolate reductase